MNSLSVKSPALRQQLWIAVVAALVFFTNLGAAALWDEDEPLYATCAREMLQRGDWVVPTYNGEVFPEKPPLMFWLMILGFKMFGINEFAARFWSAICGVLAALATYRLGRRMFGQRTALWAGLIMATSLLFTVSARAATVDAALVLLTTTAFWLFACCLETDRSARRDGQLSAGGAAEAHAGREAGAALRFQPTWWRMALIYVCLGLAVLAKGPVGVVLPVGVMGLFLAWLQFATEQPAASARAGSSGRLSRALGWARVFRPRNLWRAGWRLRPLTAILVVGLVAAPWYVMVSLRTDGQWLARFLGEQNLQRVLKPMQGHQGPIWYYVPAILIGVFPWSLMVWPGLGMTLRKLRRRDNQWAWWLLLACWLGVYFVFWSLVSTKLPHYVLPAYPALAVMMGRLIDRWLAEPAAYRRWWLHGTAVALAGVGLGILIGIPVAARFVLPGEELLGLVGLIPLAGAAIWVWQLRRGRLERLMPVLAATGACLLVAMFGFAALRVDRHQNARHFFAAIEQESCGPAQLAAYKFLRESTVFYAGRPVKFFDDLDSLRRFLDSQQQGTTYLFTSGEYAERIEQAFPGQFRVVLRRPKFLKKGEVLLLARCGLDNEPLADRIPHQADKPGHAVVSEEDKPEGPATALRPERPSQLR